MQKYSLPVNDNKSIGNDDDDNDDDDDDDEEDYEDDDNDNMMTTHSGQVYQVVAVQPQFFQ